MLEIRLLTEDERTMLTAHSHVTHPLFCRHLDRPCGVVTLLARLARARAVVEAARETAEAMDSMWGWLNVPAAVRDGFQNIADALAAHDAEAK